MTGILFSVIFSNVTSRIAHSVCVYVVAESSLTSLWHGTGSDAAKSIANEGFDLRHARGGTFGSAVNVAASPTMAHSYAALKATGDHLTLIRTNVALGPCTQFLAPVPVSQYSLSLSLSLFP